MPLRLPLLAIAAWALLSSLPMQGLPPAYRVWVLLTYAAILLALWAVLQVPAHLGLWRPGHRGAGTAAGGRLHRRGLP